MNKKATFKPGTWLLIFILGYSLSSCYKTAKLDSPVPSNPPVLPVTGSQWVHLNSLSADSITALEIFDNVIYAASATSAKIYESADNGISWSATASIGAGIHVSAKAAIKMQL